MKSIILVIAIFTSAAALAQEKGKADTIKDPIERLFVEVANIREFVGVTEERNDQIKSFKIKFTDFITDLASQDFYKIEYQKSFQEINQLESKAIKWRDEEKVFSEKTIDLLSLVNQSLISYKESIKASRGEQRYELSQNINDLTRLRSRLRNYKIEESEHSKKLESFLENITKWKVFLREKMAKLFNRNFLRWEMNEAIIDPAESFRGLAAQVKVSFSTWKKNITEIDWKKKLAPLLLIITLSLGVFWLIFFALGKFQNIDNALGGVVVEDFLGRIFTDFLNHKILVALWGAFYSARSVSEKIFFNSPNLLFFILLCSLLVLTWLKLRDQLTGYVKEIIGVVTPSSFILKTLIVCALMVSISRVFQVNFYLKNELMFLLDSLLLGVVSFIIIKYITKNILGESKVKNSVSSAIRVVVLIFSLFIFTSTVLEVIGFVHLSRVIQGVVLEDASLMMLLWFFFGVFSSFAAYYIKSYEHSENHNEYWLEFTSYIKTGLDKLFFMIIFIIILMSWMKNVFVYSDFWNIPLISIGNYKLVFKQPLELLGLFYFLKVSYLIFKFVFYTFLLKSLTIERKNAPNVLSIIRYLLIFFFLSAGMGILGFTYKNMLIFASALGVGIGFGLQGIVNNFLSGIILLFEQPIRVGDLIEVNGIFATVVSIGMRSTIVESLENSSIIIPNAEIVSNHLVNWTLQDNVMAQDCEVGVAYGTDTRLVSGLLLEVLKSTREVLDEPSPQIWFESFGDSSLKFNVRFWINKPKDKFLIKSKVMHAINGQLKQHGITIPFPQRDIHLRTASVTNADATLDMQEKSEDDSNSEPNMEALSES